MHAPAIVEMVGNAGFDYIVIDNEHGVFGWHQIEELIRTAELVQLVPIVRVSGLTEIGKALDLGAKGIHMPQVTSKEEVGQVVKAVRFPPYGHRGVAYSVRDAKYGKRSGTEYLKQSKEDVLVIVHSETPQAVQNIEGILDAGIDIA